MSNSTFCIYAVDDDEDDRLLIEATLKSYSDCEVTFFADGESLLAKLSADTTKASLPTLILLDLDMPRINGFEVLQAVRGDFKLRSIPILVLSGTRNDQTVRRAYELGANAFMSKPNTFLELNGLLQLTHTYWLKTVHTPKNP